MSEQQLTPEEPSIFTVINTIRRNFASSGQIDTEQVYKAITQELEASQNMKPPTTEEEARQYVDEAIKISKSVQEKLLILRFRVLFDEIQIGKSIYRLKSQFPERYDEFLEGRYTHDQANLLMALYFGSLIIDEHGE